jgi:hypothetical protein
MKWTRAITSLFLVFLCPVCSWIRKNSAERAEFLRIQLRIGLRRLTPSRRRRLGVT